MNRGDTAVLGTSAVGNDELDSTGSGWSARRQRQLVESAVGSHQLMLVGQPTALASVSTVSGDELRPAHVNYSEAGLHDGGLLSIRSDPGGGHH